MRPVPTVGLCAALIAVPALGPALGPAFGPAFGPAGPHPIAVAEPATVPVARQDILLITAPLSEDLGTGHPGTVISSQLNSAVTVLDERILFGQPYQISVTVENFARTGGGSIARGNLSYWSGPTTVTLGGTCTAGQPTADDAVPLDVARIAVSHTGGLALNTCSWRPTLILTIPYGAALGSYSGTLTHSVA